MQPESPFSTREIAAGRSPRFGSFKGSVKKASLKGSCKGSFKGSYG